MKTNKDIERGSVALLLEKKARGEKLNKLGEWLLTPEGRNGLWNITDYRAILR